MATMITEECISCGACEDEYPNGAISLGEEAFVIDPQLCTECVGESAEQQCVAACPPDVCVPDPDRVESEALLFERAKRLHPERAGFLRLDDTTSHFRAA